MKTILSAFTAALYSKPKIRPIKTNKIYIAHMRNYDSTGELLTNGGVTVAFTIDENAVVKSAVAVCSGHDNFCRRTGRELATERLTAEVKNPKFYLQFETLYGEGEGLKSHSEILLIEDIAYLVLDLLEDVTRSSKVYSVVESVTESHLQF